MELPGSGSDADVLEYLKLWNLSSPVFVDFEDLGGGYEPKFCHVSSKHIVQQRGGRRIHGWALWRFRQGSNAVIVGDFHSVWEQSDGKLVDSLLRRAGRGCFSCGTPVFRSGQLAPGIYSITIVRTCRRHRESGKATQSATRRSSCRKMRH